MHLRRFALVGFFLCILVPLSPVQAVNLFALSQSMEGFTQANEDEWNEGLKSISDGNFAAAFEHWKASGTPDHNGAKGYYLAQIGLSILFQNGIGVQLDESEAVRWMALGWEERETSTFQETIGNSYMGVIYTLIGRAYEEGKGVARNFDQARLAYFMGAGYQNAEARFRIGAMLESGEEAPSWDYSGAVGYYAQAAKSGHAKAQYALATMYFDGRGVPQDYKRAYLWYSLAAANQQKSDDFDAVSKRNELAAMMSPEQLALSQELAQQCMSSEYAECD